MNKKLRETIDAMVEDSIRRVLPGVMNEVLLKTIANSGIVNERAPARQAAPVNLQQTRQANQARRRSSSLEDILDEGAGSEFYADPRAASSSQSLRETTQEKQQLSKNIMSLPPELRGRAEDINVDVDGGEMWEDDDGSTSQPAQAGVSLDRAAQIAGLDFSKMRRVANVTESKIRPVDASDRAKFEEMRIQRMREKLSIPVE